MIGPLIPMAGSVLAASLLGSPHCAGMCGGFVCFYSGQERRRWLPHAAYNAGRLVSYAALGLLAGAVGSGLDHIGAARGIQGAAALCAGLIMILWGGAALLRALGLRIPIGASLAPTSHPLAAVLRNVRAQVPEVRALALGLVTTLLPCGWLYAYVAIAAGTGSALTGACVMAAFWLGTLPVMAGVGLAAQTAFGPLRRHLPVATASVLVVLGFLTLAGKFHPAPGFGHPAQCVTHEQRTR